jgi:hypothetical protein
VTRTFREAGMDSSHTQQNAQGLNSATYYIESFKTPLLYHTVGLEIKQRTITLYREPEMNVNVCVSCDVINEWNLIGNY